MTNKTQLERIKEFQEDLKGTNLLVWKEVLKEVFGIEYKRTYKGTWKGNMLDSIYAMVLKTEQQYNKPGKDFDEFENKTLKVDHNYKPCGDIRISKFYDDIDKVFLESNLRDKSKSVIFNLHHDDYLIDFRFSSMPDSFLKKDFTYLINNADRLQRYPETRKGKYISVKVDQKYKGKNNVFAWRGGQLYNFTESMLEDQSEIIIDMQREYILHLIEKYDFEYIKPLPKVVKKITKKEKLQNILKFNENKILDKNLINEIIQSI